MPSPSGIYQILFQTTSITEAQLKAILDTLDNNSFKIISVQNTS